MKTAIKVYGTSYKRSTVEKAKNMMALGITLDNVAMMFFSGSHAHLNAAIKAL